MILTLKPDYSLGDIDLFNYTYSYTSGGQSISQSGSRAWVLDIPDGVYLTVVIK